MTDTTARSLPSALALLLGACAIASCRPGGPSGPPELRLGRDECTECGMLINEDRFSSASIIEQDGHKDYARFDDIGCMLDYQRHLGAESRVVESFVHDYDSRAWIEAQNAAFLLVEGDAMSTPMGSGIAAFAGPPAAAATQAKVGGRTVPAEEIAGIRRQWAEARWGKPGEGR